jgi:uroporphyrinogen decarboxylase
VTTSRERVWLSIRHSQPDRVPYYFSFTQAASRKLQAYYGTEDLDSALDNDMVRYSTRQPALLQEVRPGFYRDEFGVVWNRSVDKDIGIPENYPLKRRSLGGYTFPDPYDPRRYRGLPIFIETHPHRFRLISYSFTLFERAWVLRGMPELMVDMLEAPEWVEELLDALMAFNMSVVEELLKHDMDGFLFGDDWGHQQGLLFSPQLWRRFIKPRLALLISTVKCAGKAAFLHSCGKVQELFPDLIEIGLDVFNPFQPDVMDVYEVKRQFGDRLAFYGGMSVQRTLPHGAPEQIRAEARRLMDEIGQGGGFIIAPSHHMPGDIPLQNMVAFIESVRGNGWERETACD